MAKTLEDVLDEDVAKEKEEKKATGQTTPSATGQGGEKTVTELPTGTKADAGEAFFEGEILAYRELGRIAVEIARLIKEKVQGRLIVYSKRDVEALPALNAFRVQARWLRDRYREIPSPASKAAIEAATATLVAATALAKGFIDVLALFRSDVEVHGREFTLDELSLIAELAHHLQSDQSTTSILYPNLGLVGDAAVSGKSAESRTEAVEDTPRKPAETVRVLLQEIAEAKGGARQRSQGKPDLEERVDVIDSQLDTFLQGLMKPDATSGETFLTTLARAEALEASLQDGKVLFVKIVRAGVGRRLIENFWTRTFVSDRISYSGGAVVTFMILDRTGTILLSRTLYSHSGYTKFSQTDPLHEEGRNFTLPTG